MSDTAKPSTAGKDNTHEEQGKLKRELNAFDLTVHTKKERQTDGESMQLIPCIL